MVLSPSLDAPTERLAKSFSFAPSERARRIETVRAGVTILLIFCPDALEIDPAREIITRTERPIWNVVDPAMTGAGVIAGKIALGN